MVPTSSAGPAGGQDSGRGGDGVGGDGLQDGEAEAVHVQAGPGAKRAWVRLRTGNGTKGERLYDWAVIEVNADDTPPGQAHGRTATF
ncbi:hypothetical protein [Streptomyces sp. NBC_01320]|uniref:hypothetical protein n=1 Tax=Streptomyces sp. NBC_01320 TaxID=2903824 RepID=UPI002E146F97|nr:hypothetical protein OG395_56320 [Streptomyces sp. NBC_01320]